MRVPCEYMLKNALFKGVILSNGKYFSGFLSFLKIESLLGNLVHNSKLGWWGEFINEKGKKKKCYTQLRHTLKGIFTVTILLSVPK